MGVNDKKTPRGGELEPLPDGFNLHSPMVQFLISVLDRLRSRHSYKVTGLSNIPEGPCLIVVNHSLATYDVMLLMQEIFERLGRYPRGLGDKRLFQVPGVAQLVSYLGGVMASHGAGERLLDEGLLVVVAPGGMKEALRPKEERYQVRWSDRKGFVRLALRTGAPLVMAACPKADELYDVVESDLTRRIYDQFHLPVPILRGVGPGGLLPRKVRLSHILSEPIAPPEVDLTDQSEFDKAVDSLHAECTRIMSELLRSEPAEEK
jgi:hypothetical protein